MSARPLIVGLGGRLRQASTSEQLVPAVLAACGDLGAETRMFDGPTLAALPHFDHEATEQTASEGALVEAVRRCDGVEIGSPGYHGGYSGLVKNAIDLLEYLRHDERVYFDCRPIGLAVNSVEQRPFGMSEELTDGQVADTARAQAEQIMNSASGSSR